MTPFEEDLARSLRLLEPTRPVTDQQWTDNAARLSRHRRSTFSPGLLAASAAVVVSLLVAGTILLVHHFGSDQRRGPLEHPIVEQAASCGSVSDAGGTAVRSPGSSATTINLQYLPGGVEGVLCFGNDVRAGQLTPEPGQQYTVTLVSLGEGSTWLVGLGPDTGDTADSVRITTSDGQTRTVTRSAAVRSVGGRPVYVVAVAAGASWVRSEFLDAQGRRLQLSKTPLASAPTPAEAESAASSLSAAASSAVTGPSTSVPPFGPDLSCVSSVTPAPEYWLVLSCAGTPQHTTLWFGHGGTPADNSASASVLPDDSQTFPYLAQMGTGSDVLVGAFPADTTTAELTMTDGATVTVGIAGHEWIPLRSGWKGLIYRADSAERVERISTFGSDRTLLGTQELFY